MSLLFWRDRTDKKAIEPLPARAGAGLDASALVPLIKSREWVRDRLFAVQEAGAPAPTTDPWIEDYNEQLVVVYAEYASAFRYCRRSDVAACGIPLEHLRPRALQNLKERTPARSVTSRAPVYFINVGGHLEASMLLLEEFWSDKRLRTEGAMLVAVPDRDSLAVAMSSLPGTVWEFARVTAQAHRTQPFPISPLLFTRTAEGAFTAIDSGLNDDSHPIPNLDVIDAFGVKNDGGATLALVIATPLDASPRSVFRLFKKVEGYLAYIASEAFRAECGPPSPENTAIRVRIHRESAPEIFDLLADVRNWTEEHQSLLTVNTDE